MTHKLRSRLAEEHRVGLVTILWRLFLDIEARQWSSNTTYRQVHGHESLAVAHLESFYLRQSGRQNNFPSWPINCTWLGTEHLHRCRGIYVLKVGGCISIQAYDTATPERDKDRIGKLLTLGYSTPVHEDAQRPRNYVLKEKYASCLQSNTDLGVAGASCYVHGSNLVIGVWGAERTC